jgi:HrpA-like RNA helicase
MMSQSSSSSDSATTVVGSQLVTVNISLASGAQRAGRTGKPVAVLQQLNSSSVKVLTLLFSFPGRVSAGTVYRLYNEEEANYNFLKHTVPEMLRMELSQLVLHALSFSSSDTSNPLRLLLETPDPPTKQRLKQTIRGLVYQGLVEGESDCETNLRLTPLGHAVSTMPASPRIGRMLFMGLALRAIGPALDIAALLSVPKLLMAEFGHKKPHCSDVMLLLKEYDRYLKMGDDRGKHQESRSFELVGRVRRQLEDHMLNYFHRKNKGSSNNIDLIKDQCNENGERLASFIALIVSATPHVAHLVDGQSNFSVRDIAGTATMHPSSVNYENDRRVHWYVYNELRVTKKPFLYLTTAVSPLDIALFSDANDLSLKMIDDSEVWGDDWGGYKSKENFSDDWLFAVDQWVPVNVRHSDRELFLELRTLLNDTMLQQVAQDPVSVLASKEYKQIVLYVLAALERQRLGI